MGKINASDKIMFKNQKKRNMEIKENFNINIRLKDYFVNGVHSFLKRADTRGSGDIIYRI